jgi:signal transduction histidine kinase
MRPGDNNSADRADQRRKSGTYGCCRRKLYHALSKTSRGWRAGWACSLACEADEELAMGAFFGGSAKAALASFMQSQVECWLRGWRCLVIRFVSVSLMVSLVLSFGAFMLEAGYQVQPYSARTQRFSEGVFWFCIAAALLLALLEAHLSLQTPLPLSMAWVGVFVLYYGLRSMVLSSLWWCRFSCGLQRSGGRWWHDPCALLLLFDLSVITGLVALSGGWASPLYVLYLGWVAALWDGPSTLLSFCFSGLAASAFVLAALLVPHQPFTMLQTTLLVERALLLLGGALGISGLRVYVRHMKAAWEAERQRWDVLRKTVFAHLSHELYTPLSAISASAALLAAEDGPLAERQRQLVGVIERNCSHMNLLIDDLLLLWKEPERQRNGALPCFDALEVARAVGQMLEPLLEGKQQRLVFEAEVEGARVVANRHQLEQVLLNLVVNAHKYTPAGKVITLAIGGQEHEVLFAVRDEGPGMPLEEQGRLFELFYQGTNSLASSRGFGIGLALAKALVVLQGGRIWVESMPGKGSTFYVTLPTADVV